MIDQIVLQSWLERTTLVQELLHASSLPNPQLRCISDLLFEVEAEFGDAIEEFAVGVSQRAPGSARAARATAARLILKK